MSELYFTCIFIVKIQKGGRLSFLEVSKKIATTTGRPKKNPEQMHMQRNKLDVYSDTLQSPGHATSRYLVPLAGSEEIKPSTLGLVAH